MTMGRIVGLVLLVAGCSGPPPTTGCRCAGAVPGGVLDVACGGSQCVGGQGYRCVDANTAEPDPSACGVPDSGPAPCGPDTCGGCCSAGVCQSGSTDGACGAGGGPCRSCGGGTACAGGVCSASGCSFSASRGDTCTGDDICICPGGSAEPLCEGTGTCSTAYGRRYSIFVGSLTLPDRRPDGMCWDAFCGAPDPFVQIRVNGGLLGTSPAVADSFRATLNYGVESNITAGSSIEIAVFDQDVSADDGAFTCRFASVDSALLRGRDLSCSGALGELLAVITPL